MIASEINPTQIVEINIHDRIESSFPVLDVFVQVACFIARGGNLGVIGKEIESYKKMIEIQPKIDATQTQIFGSVIYIDNYGNVISNISKKLFTEIGKGRKYRVKARSYTFEKIQQKYNDIINYDIDEDRKHYDGNKLAIFNSAGFIEIAIYRSNLKTVGGASTLLGLSYRDSITVEFY
jgi:S-adenosylmethionine hydrolase